MSQHLYRADNSGPWKPNKVSMSLYAEAKFLAVESYNKTYFTGLRPNPLQYANHVAKFMGYIDAANKIVDQAISDMIFGDTHKT